MWRNQCNRALPYLSVIGRLKAKCSLCPRSDWLHDIFCARLYVLSSQCQCHYDLPSDPIPAEAGGRYVLLSVASLESVVLKRLDTLTPKNSHARDLHMSSFPWISVLEICLAALGATGDYLKSRQGNR